MTTDLPAIYRSNRHCPWDGTLHRFVTPGSGNIGKCVECSVYASAVKKLRINGEDMRQPDKTYHRSIKPDMCEEERIERSAAIKRGKARRKEADNANHSN